MDILSLLEQVSEVARQAGRLFRDFERPETFTKEGHANFVTSADLASQELVLAALSPLLPGAHFFSEEQEENRLFSGYNWIVDPIDGTTNFLRGFRHSCVSIGLVRDGEAVLGAVYNPYQDELFTAAAGCGAALNGAPIQASVEGMENALILFGTAPYYREKADETFSVVKRLFLACGDLRRSGSAALDLCYVAAGRCDGFYEAQLSPWDYAAASVILREAGAVIGTLPPHRFGYGEVIPIVAGNRRVFPAVLEAAAPGER